MTHSELPNTSIKKSWSVFLLMLFSAMLSLSVLVPNVGQAANLGTFNVSSLGSSPQAITPSVGDTITIIDDENVYGFWSDLPSYVSPSPAISGIGQTITFTFTAASTSSGRIAYDFEGPFDIVTWSSVSGGVQSCSSGSAELWFLNDESLSVDSTEFTQSTTFMSYVEDGFSFSSSEFRGGIISWSGSSNQAVESSLTTSFQSAIDAYAATTPFGSNTAPAEALTYAATQVTNGARTGVPSVVVLMTDASDTQLTSNSANFIAAADSIRATTGNEVVVMLIAEAATAYGASSSVKTTIDAVAGSSANVIVGASYADIADPTNTYINSLVGTVCTVAANAAVALNGPSVDWVDWTMPSSYGNANTGVSDTYATGASGTVTNPNNAATVGVTLTGEVLSKSADVCILGK